MFWSNAAMLVILIIYGEKLIINLFSKKEIYQFFIWSIFMIFNHVSFFRLWHYHITFPLNFSIHFLKQLMQFNTYYPSFQVKGASIQHITNLLFIIFLLNLNAQNMNMYKKVTCTHETDHFISQTFKVNIAM